MEDQRKTFRAMIVKISDEIETANFSNLKSMCRDCIGGRVLSKITTPLQLFDELEKQKKVKPNDVQFMIHLLENGCRDRPHLTTVVRDYQNKYSSSNSASAGE